MFNIGSVILIVYLLIGTAHLRWAVNPDRVGMEPIRLDTLFKPHEWLYHSPLGGPLRWWLKVAPW